MHLAVSEAFKQVVRYPLLSATVCEVFGGTVFAKGCEYLKN